MPVRLTNRFSADRDLGPARIDTNFEDLRRWSGDMDDLVAGVESSLTSSIAALDAYATSEIDSLTTFTNALQSDLATETADRAAADSAEATTRAAADTALDAAIVDVESDINDFLIWQNCMFVGSNASASVFDSTNTNIPITAESYDPYAWHSGSSHLVIPNVAGFYTATASVRMVSGGAAVTRMIATLWDGTNIYAQQDLDGIGGWPRTTVTMPDLYFNGTSDQIAVMVWQNSGGTKDFVVDFSLRLVNPT